jgi:hypothetical protein
VVCDLSVSSLTGGGNLEEALLGAPAISGRVHVSSRVSLPPLHSFSLPLLSSLCVLSSVLRSYEAYNRDVALLHQSMRTATMEIFGSDYSPSHSPEEDYEEERDRDGAPAAAFPQEDPQATHTTQTAAYRSSGSRAAAGDSLAISGGPGVALESLTFNDYGGSGSGSRYRSRW